MLFYSIEDDTQKFGRFWTKKSFFTRKSHLRQSCTKPFKTTIMIIIMIIKTIIMIIIMIVNWMA